ncbi:MAG: oligosaccharide flippase family protein, partial [Pseudomonadales bacterium]|nr:oligosaccharide flippase family protein [Pseudomonadales bacterium]
AYYDESVLAPVICMIGLSIIIGGFKSVALLVYDKRLDLRTQIVTGLCVQISGLVVMVVWALIAPGIWALVIGQLFSACVELVLSYVVFEGHHSRFAWDRKAVSECFHFGKWIVVSSSISYITNQGDRLIIGKFMSMAELGIYSIASNWAALVSIVSYELSTRVLHPFFRQSLENSADVRAIKRTRLGLNTVYASICLGLAVSAEFVVDLLYDDRYGNVAWMLQVLAIGQIPRSFTVTLRPFLTAMGDSFSQMAVSTGSAVILVGLILLGGELGGTAGVVLAYAFSGFLMHPLMMISASRHGLHCWFHDGPLMLAGPVVGLVILYAFDGAIFEVLESMGAVPSSMLS